MAKRSIDKNKGEARTKNHMQCRIPKCHKKIAKICKACNRGHCEYHSAPKMVLNYGFVTSLDPRKDPVLYAKCMADWNRKDGHPCTTYTEQWLASHNPEQKAKELNELYDLIAKKKKSIMVEDKVSVHEPKRDKKKTGLIKAGLTCEYCGSNNTVPIIYGYIPEGIKPDKNYGKDYIYGGCLVGKSMYCKKCHKEFEPGEIIPSSSKPDKMGIIEKIKDALGLHI